MATMRVMALMVVLVVVALPTVLGLSLSCTEPFKAVANKWCVAANISVPEVAHTWPGARSACQRIKGDLIILEEDDKMQAITAHLLTQFSEGRESYPFWVGGRGNLGKWTWVDGSPMNLQSNMWIPDSPYEKLNNGVSHTLLIQAGPWKRRYMESMPPESNFPGYICEK
ncbi:uncharacterized protein LOC123503050 [Portunus trituberculatus]|uniref:uncharacterized protein LOC123503050 n=1 Tax=Portunus trituberculatus TaxID=210409 RepID=UPI001E1D0D18|nr:uncharacterized protein LOC123503050 [Portunus trituberculatus]